MPNSTQQTVLIQVGKVKMKYISGFFVFVLCWLVADSSQAETVCNLYNTSLAAGPSGVSDSLVSVQQVPALLSQEGQTIIQDIGLGSTNTATAIAFFNQESACGSQMVPLVQQQYDSYLQFGNAPLSTYGLPVTGAVSVVTSNGAGYNRQTFAPDSGSLADFTSMALLSLGQTIQNTILTVQASINAYNNIPKP
jgi:hypothetical protein